MAYKLSVKHEALPKDELIELSQIAAVPNGGSLTLTLEQEAAFENKYGTTPDKYFDENPGIFSVQVTAGKAKSSADMNESVPLVGTEPGTSEVVVSPLVDDKS